MDMGLNEAIINGDTDIALSLLDKKFDRSENLLEIHNSLFPSVHRVLNPPFINPHMPKMYAVLPDFFHCLTPEDLKSLIRLEVSEYTQRKKLSAIPPPKTLPSQISFETIQNHIRLNKPNETAKLMAAFIKQYGVKVFATKLLLLGSNYLDRSLGHSVSCTALILLEMMNRKEQDIWPVLVLLSDYFCKGGFSETPDLKKTCLFVYNEAYLDKLSQAVSDTGIVALHHTITLWAIEKVRFLFNTHEYEHMLCMWESYLGNNDLYQLRKIKETEKDPDNFDAFFNFFSKLETEPAAKMISGMAGNPKGRDRMCRFLIKGLCRLYQGNYDPHFFTGLGSMLWISEQFQDQPEIIFNAVYQYVDYYFNGIG